jgi:hypothetical protein
MRFPRTTSAEVLAAQLTVTAGSGSGGSKLVLSTWIVCPNAAFALPVEGQFDRDVEHACPLARRRVEHLTRTP